MQLQAYQKLVMQLAIELQHYLVSRGARRETAEDIVQDVFVKVLEMELVLPPDKLRPYLYRVAWSTYLDHYRRNQRYRDLVRRYIRPELGVEQSMPGEDSLGHALAKLSAKEQRLLLLRYDQELSMAAIAQQLGIRPAAVKMRLQRIYRKLEKILRSEDR